MRLWTLHPRYLDPKGLVALWREALLAQAVLLGRTRGYTRHPQLERFLAAPDPPAAISSYLSSVHAEALERGYRFDASRIVRRSPSARLPETRGQLEYEWGHFGGKVRSRDPRWFELRCQGVTPTPRPLFRICSGGVRAWERVRPPGADGA